MSRKHTSWFGESRLFSGLDGTNTRDRTPTILSPQPAIRGSRFCFWIENRLFLVFLTSLIAWLGDFENIPPVSWRSEILKSENFQTLLSHFVMSQVSLQRRLTGVRPVFWLFHSRTLADPWDAPVLGSLSCEPSAPVRFPFTPSWLSY